MQFSRKHELDFAAIRLEERLNVLAILKEPHPHIIKMLNLNRIRDVSQPQKRIEDQIDGMVNLGS